VVPRCGRRVGTDRQHRGPVRPRRPGPRGLCGRQGRDHRATASLAKELGPSGILVSAVALTQILTVKDGAPSIPSTSGRPRWPSRSSPAAGHARRSRRARRVARVQRQHLRQRRDDLVDRRRPALRRGQPGPSTMSIDFEPPTTSIA
jgi:hypothetical protein